MRTFVIKRLQYKFNRIHVDGFARAREECHYSMRITRLSSNDAVIV